MNVAEEVFFFRIGTGAVGGIVYLKNDLRVTKSPIFNDKEINTNMNICPKVNIILFLQRISVWYKYTKDASLVSTKRREYSHESMVNKLESRNFLKIC